MCFAATYPQDVVIHTPIKQDKCETFKVPIKTNIDISYHQSHVITDIVMRQNYVDGKNDS